MAIWGSLIGGMIGLSLGGPFGMLLGSLIGGKISRAKSRAGLGAFAQPQQIFALSLIVLSAKLSKADGQVSKEELIAVKDKLRIPDNELDQVGKIFNKAKEESTGYERYAQQIAQIYKGNINFLFMNCWGDIYIPGEFQSPNICPAVPDFLDREWDGMLPKSKAITSKTQ